MGKTTESSRVLAELLETTAELSAYGLVSKTDMSKMKALCEEPPAYSSEQVVTIRTQVARVSQAVFATLLNVSLSTVQKWESPAADRHPNGPAARLLQLVETKGVRVLMP